jgi:hypothetical protein
VPRIAVIQDGTELARQTDADVAGCFERCCELLSADGGTFTAQVFTDDSVGYLLEHADSGEYQCLVLASNALISEQVGHALERSQDKLRKYLDHGGGLVVLHQLVDSLAIALPDDLCPALADRVSPRGEDQAVARDPGDVLLNYPEQVSLEQYRDGEIMAGPPSLFYKALRPDSLPEKLRPIVGYRDEILLARTYDHVPERVVVCSLPLDWQGRVELLANTIRFGSAGRPKRLVWRERTGAHSAMLVRWLSMDGGASVRPIPGPGRPIESVDRWLLGNVDVAVMPPDRLEAASDWPEVRRFLAAGGTLLTADRAVPQPASKIVALVGEYAERRLAARLYGELRAVRDWDAVDYAFELRNIVIALALLWMDPANHTKIAIGPDELQRLARPLRDRLRDASHREDLSSSIAHAQSLAFLSGDQPLDIQLGWMSGDPRQHRYDVGLQIRAVHALASRNPDPGFVASAAQGLRDNPDLVSVASVIRVLDAIAVLDQARLLGDEPGAARDLTELVCGFLERLAGESGAGWLSVEATADVARGLIALLDRLASGDAALADRASDLLGMAVSVLRQAFGRYERNRKGVAWLARLTHAVVRAERSYPMGLQRLATLDWPERSDDDQQAIGVGLPLLEHLALENKALRDREREFDGDRLAARVGRAAASIGVTALVAAPFGYVLVRVGFKSGWALLGNITVLLTMLLGIAAGAFTLLARWNLLARPARRVYEWIISTIPVLSWLGKARDG